MSSSVRIFAINGFVSYSPDVVQTSVYSLFAWYSTVIKSKLILKFEIYDVAETVPLRTGYPVF